MTTAERTKKIQHWMARKALGRKAAVDLRDLAHPMKAALPQRVSQSTKYWQGGMVLDQGNLPQCVAYAWTGFLLAAPIMDKAVKLGGDYEQKLYTRAQQLDEWPGEGYDGTSVRAGAKALQEQGRLKEYVWAKHADEVRRFVLDRGPVILGIDWYEEMFYPTSKGFITIGGQIAGGHAIEIIGYSDALDAFRLIQSWGPSWGQKGRCWLSFDDLDKLITDGGEACSAVEQKL